MAKTLKMVRFGLMSVPTHSHSALCLSLRPNVNYRHTIRIVNIIEKWRIIHRTPVYIYIYSAQWKSESYPYSTAPKIKCIYLQLLNSPTSKHMSHS